MKLYFLTFNVISSDMLCRLVRGRVSMSHPEFLTINSISTTSRHCEAQFEVHLRSIQSSTAASPKQSPCADFAANLVRGDCFVAPPLQNSVNTNPCQIYSKNAPRNDELKRNVELATTQTLHFGMTHVDHMWST
jgi:hypothetical protein